VIVTRWSIVIGNAILAVAYGLIWSGARNFEGKRVSIVVTVAGALIWLAAYSIGPIYARPEARATVMAAIAITYALLTVIELWRGDDAWRWPIILLLLGHAAAIPVRIPLAGAWTNSNPFDVDLRTFAIFEAVFLCICAAYLATSHLGPQRDEAGAVQAPPDVLRVAHPQWGKAKAVSRLNQP